MERSTRFIIEQRCGKKDAELFQAVMNTVAAYIEQSDDLTFLSDGERRYGNTLFELCAEVLQDGRRGRPPKTLPEGVKVHVKNKGSQNTSVRRQNSVFRRRTNTYAKSKEGLQRTLDVHQIIHSFVRCHWTTGIVPAVALGVIKEALCLEDILTGRFA